jgi:heme/copper-type cytochrome/quinol oxidase subunit 2
MMRCFGYSVFAMLLVLSGPACAGEADYAPMRQAVLAFVAAVCFAAAGAVVVSVLRHRHAAREAKHFHERVGVELVWTLIPFAILFALAWPAARAILP